MNQNQMFEFFDDTGKIDVCSQQNVSRLCLFMPIWVRVRFVANNLLVCGADLVGQIMWLIVVWFKFDAYAKWIIMQTEFCFFLLLFPSFIHLQSDSIWFG